MKITWEVTTNATRDLSWRMVAHGTEQLSDSSGLADMARDIITAHAAHYFDEQLHIEVREAKNRRVILHGYIDDFHLTPLP